MSILEECVEDYRLQSTLDQMKTVGVGANHQLLSNEASKIFSTAPLSNIKSFEVPALSTDYKNEEMNRDTMEEEVRNPTWLANNDTNGQLLDASNY